jgi:hypothetical protein
VSIFTIFFLIVFRLFSQKGTRYSRGKGLITNYYFREFYLCLVRKGPITNYYFQEFYLCLVRKGPITNYYFQEFYLCLVRKGPITLDRGNYNNGGLKYIPEIEERKG